MRRGDGTNRQAGCLWMPKRRCAAEAHVLPDEISGDVLSAKWKEVPVLEQLHTHSGTGHEHFSRFDGCTSRV